MARDEVDSVLDHYRLPGGPVWTLPIVLQKSKSELSGIEIGREAALVNEADGDIYAVLKIRDIYPFPFDEVCRKWFGTLDDSHPGVFRLRRGGDCFVGAEVRLLKRRSTSLRPYEFTPQQLRHIFETKGWSRVVGFHTRNAAHRGHEAIQRIALEMTDCDGLLISPVTGGKKKGDFTSEVIINSYQMMLDNGAFGEGRVFIAAFPTHSRYSGAREAVFTALCRKNYGCSHFIVGRDHTGVGNFYEPLSAKKLFESLGDIGIKPVFFDAVQFCPFCNDYVFDCPHPGEKRFGISGTAVRSYITRRAKPPEWLMRKEVSDFIIGRMNDGMEVFVP
jgi:ATP sulfurylase